MDTNAIKQAVDILAQEAEEFLAEAEPILEEFEKEQEK